MCAPAAVNIVSFCNLTEITTDVDAPSWRLRTFGAPKLAVACKPKLFPLVVVSD
jgi:hypothetical protein